MWSIRTVTNILKDQTYRGDMVQGKYRVKSYKIHTQISTPPKEWYIVQGTHEPIIAQEVFQKARELQARDTRAAPQKNTVYLFSGFLRCADCGGGVSRHTAKGGQPPSYYCSTYKNQSKAACTKHAIRHDKLVEAVLLAIRRQIYIGVDREELLSRLGKASVMKGRRIQFESQLQDRERELEKITRYRRSLYEDWKEGDISKEDYRRMNTDYEVQSERLQAILERLKEERGALQKETSQQDPVLSHLMEHGNIDTLTREILTVLVETIWVHEGGDISIQFKFADEPR